MAPAAAVGLSNHKGSACVRVKSRIASCTKTSTTSTDGHSSSRLDASVLAKIQGGAH